jgi:hypothetical protein
MDYNINVALSPIGQCGKGWIDLAQDRDHWMTLVNVVMSLGFYKMLESP